MILALVFLLIFFSFVIIKSAEMSVVALRRISRNTKTSVFALSAIILAIGTSFPELFVSITSAVEGVSNLSLGLVIGSNIANISLVAAIAALVVGGVEVHGDFLRRDVLIALVAGVLPVFLVLDGHLGRTDGFILLAAYGAYASSFFKMRFLQIAAEDRGESFFHRLMQQIDHVDSLKTREYGRLFIGIAILLFSADAIVRVSKGLASIIGIPVFVVGLVILAIGTSLPELAFSLRSLKDHQPKMFFGNLLGSTIANSTLVIGVAAVINPVEIVAVRQYFLAAAAFVVIFIVFWIFIRTKHRLERWEAGVLILLYVIFVVVELL